MTNLIPPDIDPTYLTDNYPDYYCCRVIKTEQRLQEIVADALVSGTLDISHCVVDVDFYLFKILERQEEKIITTLDEIYIECNFELVATFTIFNKFNYFKSIDFKKPTFFGYATFNGWVSFEQSFFSLEQSIC